MNVQKYPTNNDPANIKKESEAAFNRKMKWALIYALIAALLSTYNLITTALWTLQTRDYYSSVLEAIDAVNQKKEFHIASTNCENPQFNPFRGEVKTLPGSTTDPNSSQRYVEIVDGDKSSTCMFDQCVFHVAGCKRVEPLNPTPPLNCNLEVTKYVALRCNLYNNVTKPGGSMDLCFLYGPIGDSPADYRRRVVYDAFNNYLGSENPVWKHLNCSTKNESTQEFTNMRKIVMPVKVNWMPRIVNAAALLVVAKELLKMVVLFGSMCSKTFTRPQWFSIAINSPFIFPFFFSKYYRRLMTVTQEVSSRIQMGCAYALEHKLVLPGTRNCLDLFLDDGIQIGVTVYLMYTQYVNFPDSSIDTYSILSVGGNVASVAYTVYRIALDTLHSCRSNISSDKARSLEGKLNML